VLRDEQLAGSSDGLRNRALALLLEGASLSTVLHQILQDLEAVLPDSMCSVLMVRDQQLVEGMSPSLPQPYMEAVNNVRIGEGIGSCGTAAFRNERVIVSDISTDPLWADFQALAALAGVKACWSEPVRSARNDVLGTFAVYYPHPRVPTDTELLHIESAAMLVALAIEQHRGLTKLRKLALAVRHSPIGVAITSESGVIEYCNQSFRDITGYSKDELHGQRLSLLRSHETPLHTYKDLWQTIQSGRCWRGEILNRRKNGEGYVALDHISPILDDNGRVINYVLSQEDITHIRRMETAADHASRHDLLTGLLNRESFKGRLTAALAGVQREGQFGGSCYMVMLDVDHFRLVNEAAGRVAGDQILRQVVVRLQQVFGDCSELARLGGDQFALLLKDHERATVVELLERLADDMAGQRFQWKEHQFVLTLSAGVVELADGDDLRDVLLRGEGACSEASQPGRNGYHFYQRGNDQHLLERQGYVQWAGEVRRALDDDGFELFAQRIEPLAGNALPDYEVLLRLQMSDGRRIAPGAFMPAAERYNLMKEIDRWVISHTLAWCRNNRAAMARIGRLAINLSGFSLSDPAMLEWVEQQVCVDGALAGQLKFEITETVCIENIALAERFIRTLQACGCEFALDDFGAGLSSFGYLKSLPVNTLKIDGQFVRDMLTDDVDRALVRSINETGHIMGMNTVAEFVENAETAALLAELGVDFAQGYGIEMPRPLQELAESALLQA